jgi:hypothetical protein
MTDNNKKPTANVMVGFAFLIVVISIILIVNYAGTASAVPVVKATTPNAAKPVTVPTDIIYQTSQTRVNERTFCKFGYQFLSTILSTERNYGVSISTIQVMEVNNGGNGDRPMKCTEK